MTNTSPPARNPGWAYAVPGVLGATFMALGAFGVGWFPLHTQVLDWPVVHFAQTDNLGLALSRSLVVVGAALLLHAWLVLGADTLHHRVHDVRTVQRVLASWCVPLLCAPPLFSRDVYSYYMQGRVLAEGGNPYLSGVSVVPGWFTGGVDPMWADAKTPYGPAFLAIERAIAQLAGESAFTAALLFRLVAIVGIALIAASLPHLARFHGIDAPSAVWLGATSPIVVMHLVAGAHNDALMIGLTCASLWAAVCGKRWSSFVLVALALAVKPVAIVALPFVAYQCAAGATVRNRIVAGMQAVAVCAATLVSLSWILNVGPLGWLEALATPGSVRSWLSPMTGIGIGWGAFMQALGFAHFMDISITITRVIGSLTLGITLMYLALRPGGRSATRSTALCFGALVLLGPAVQPWYLLWALPLFAVTGLSRNQVRECITMAALFTVHGVANSAATADTFIEFSDGLAILAAAVILALVVVASRRERAFILDAEAMKPTTAQNAATAIQARLA